MSPRKDLAASTSSERKKVLALQRAGGQAVEADGLALGPVRQLRPLSHHRHQRHPESARGVDAVYRDHHLAGGEKQRLGTNEGGMVVIDAIGELSHDRPFV